MSLKYLGFRASGVLNSVSNATAPSNKLNMVYFLYMNNDERCECQSTVETETVCVARGSIGGLNFPVII